MPKRRRVFLLMGLLAAMLLLAWRIDDVVVLWARHQPSQRLPIPELPNIAAGLEPVAEGFEQITDLQVPPPPLPDSWLAVLEKPGKLWLLDRHSQQRRVILEVEVATSSEEGLLGLAFDPDFAQNRRFFTNSVGVDNGQDRTHIDAWTFPPVPADGSLPKEMAVFVKQIMAFDQPYANHNGGQLAFGPDGMLYIGTGDGGSGGDPHRHAQNPSSWLGKMLRVDVRGVGPETGYAVPPDNPWVGKPGVLPELWALGLRNPWRFSFDRAGRLLVADVGQNHLEELDLVLPGANLGWNVREGRECFDPPQGCATQGLTDPFWQGDHPDHVSLTGGYVYEGTAIPGLQGKLVLGDFVVRRLWAVDVPPVDQPSLPSRQYWLLDHELSVTTFARERDGGLLVGDFGGRIARLVPVVGRRTLPLGPAPK